MKPIIRPSVRLGSAAGGVLLLASLFGSGVKAQSPTPADLEVAQLPPLTERQMVESTVDIEGGTISMMVHNNTGVSITYRVVGNTGFRVLPAGESTMLTGLPVPVNFFIERNDEGLTTASVEASPTEDNMIEVTVDEALYPDAEVRSVLVNETGQVFFL